MDQLVSDELESGVKGKQGELYVIGHLLREGFRVYTPLVDFGVDCLVDAGDSVYKEIQVKYRESKPILELLELRCSSSGK